MAKPYTMNDRVFSIRFIRLVTRLDRALNRVEIALLVAFLSMMVILAFLQVVLRYFWAQSIPLGDVLTRHLVLPASFMGAAIAVGEGRHVGTDLITRSLGERYGRIVRGCTLWVASIICGFLGEAAWSFVLSEFEALQPGVSVVPLWLGMAVMPVGYGLLTLHFFLKGSVVLVSRTSAEEN
jgi:TRAP-type C4-dicarboxylate transport system permease small subunit